MWPLVDSQLLGICTYKKMGSWEGDDLMVSRGELEKGNEGGYEYNVLYTSAKFSKNE